MKIVFVPRFEDYIQFQNEMWRRRRRVHPDFVDFALAQTFLMVMWVWWLDAEGKFFVPVSVASLILSIPITRLRYWLQTRWALWRLWTTVRAYKFSRTELELLGEQLILSENNSWHEIPVVEVRRVDASQPGFIGIDFTSSGFRLIRRDAVVEGDLDEFMRHLRAARSKSGSSVSGVYQG